MIGALRMRLPGLAGGSFGGLTVAAADEFAYEDPTDGSVSRGQGLRILFEGGARAVFRLSGTGTEGATLRVYLERFEPADGAHGEETQEALAPVIRAAETIAGIVRHTGRRAPDVVT